MIHQDLDDIQGIIVGSYAQLKAARFLLLEIRDPAAARSWLGELAGEVRKAADGVPEAGPCANVAFTFSGLEKLELAAQALKSFAREFQEGMWNNPRRQRILGDRGASAPENWRWGGPNNDPVDVLLLLYAADASALEELYESHRARFAARGLAEVPGGKLDSRDLGHLEHFGFRDGVSQPKIAGLTGSTDEKHIVAAGEFLLGYPNGYGQLTNRPMLDPIHDREGVLARDAYGTDQSDFGRNGSYLVFRQLEQDVGGFWRFLDQATKRADGTSDDEARDGLAAKMVGRWRSGAPLVKAAERDDPSLAQDNDFLYDGNDDHDGLKCPLGAHVRRTHPRDSLRPPKLPLLPPRSTREVLAVANRHRLIRRGRPYGEPLAEPLTPQGFLENAGKGGERGLYFLCFNANVNRQFEFIQNTWVNSPNFDRLYTDSDPLIGDRRDGGDSFTVPARPVRKCIKNLPRFVEVKGGAYFFMPGVRALRFLAREPRELASLYAAPAPPASTGPPPASLRAMRAVNRLLEALRKLSRRRIFVPFRNAFDVVFRPAIVATAQFLINLRRKDEHLGIAEERHLPGEEEVTRQATEQMTAFLFRHYRASVAERAGNTKTYGLVKASFEVLPDLDEKLAVGVFQPGRSYKTYVRFGGPGPLASPDIENNGILSLGVKLMGVEGAKLIDDEEHTQDFTAIGAPTFTTPNVFENLKLQQHIGGETPIFYFVNPFDSHFLDAVMQGVYAKSYANPLEVRYWSCVPYLYGEARAIQYSFTPASGEKSRIPWRPSDDYLREAMVETLARREVVFDVTVQFQTDPHRMPIENASVIWPEKLSPPVRVARLRIPVQRFDSEAQLAFARNLSFNPWHCIAEHRPLGNQNRARKHIYYETSKVRQRINGERRIEPTGDEEFD